jgi:hypothetical protein
MPNNPPEASEGKCPTCGKTTDYSKGESGACSNAWHFHGRMTDGVPWPTPSALPTDKQHETPRKALQPAHYNVNGVDMKYAPEAQPQESEPTCVKCQNLMANGFDENTADWAHRHRNHREPTERLFRQAGLYREDSAAVDVLIGRIVALLAAEYTRGAREVMDRILGLPEMQPEQPGDWQHPNLGIKRREDIRNAIKALQQVTDKEPK